LIALDIYCFNGLDIINIKVHQPFFKEDLLLKHPTFCNVPDHCQHCKHALPLSNTSSYTPCYW